jgi:hypothetical protein
MGPFADCAIKFMTGTLNLLDGGSLIRIVARSKWQLV